MKTTTKFTPGPWDDASQYDHIDSIRIFAKTHYIGTIGNSDDSKEQTQANARLISAAPDLFQTLERLVYQAESHGIEGVYWDEARVALNKATGETK